MARATKWTDEKIKALKLPEGKTEVRSLVESGLYLFARQRSKGDVAKQWQYRAQVGGVRKWLSLGAYPAVRLAAARAELARHHAAHEAAKKGEADHPVIAARFARKASIAMPTVAELFKEWIADKRLGSARKGGRPVRERTVQVLQENFDADIRDRIGDAKIAKITREALQSCIDAPRKRGSPGSAAKVYVTLRGLVNFATARGHIEGADPMRGIENPRPYRPAPVNAANDADLVSLMADLEASQLWPSTKLAIELQLLTGVRPVEIRLADWSEFDTDRAVWTIPADRVKTGREFKVHLSKQALQVLERARTLRGKSGYVFPGSEGEALEKMAIARALRRMAARGTKKLSPHDLRRTFRTALSRLGVQPHIAELCLNHIEAQTMRRVYDGHDYFGEMAGAWDLMGSHLASLRAGGAQVIPIKARA